MSMRSTLLRMSYQLEITLEDIDPPVWRRVVVPADFTLLDLHHVIQIAMGWKDCHLHNFTIKRQRYTTPHEDDFDDAIDESTVALRDVIRPGSKFSYQYDFGDDWNHVIVVEKTVPDRDTVAPICVDGARACPPEDSGGPWGYMEKLEALAHPNDDETEELREWIGDFDAERFDLQSVNKQLRRFFAAQRK